MAKFRFSQEKQVTTWMRDYYNVEADSLEEAIAIIQNANEPLEMLKLDDERVTFDTRDMDCSLEWFLVDADYGLPSNYAIICCDTGDEIVSKY